MGKTVNDFLDKAKEWRGFNESDGSFKKIIDTYNEYADTHGLYHMSYDDEWCACFVSAVAIANNATDIVPVEVSCERMINKLKELGCWIEDESITPQTGDIIFFDWDDSGVGDCTGWSEHVGIVNYVIDKRIYIIEGNNNEEVVNSTRLVDSRFIRGYGRPKYYVEHKEPVTVTQVNLEEIANQVIRGEWGNGEERKKKLINAGWDYNAVQALVNQKMRGK